MAPLGIGKGYRPIGPDRVGQQSPRIRIGAAGHIDGNDGAPAIFVDEADQFQRPGTHFPPNTGAQQSIDDHVRLHNPACQFTAALSRILDHGEAHIAAYLVKDAGVRGQLFRRTGQPENHLPTGGGQMAGRHKPVSTVVAGSGEDEGGTRTRESLPQQPGHRLPGIFHQHHTGNADRFDGITVQIAHLLCSCQVHTCPSQPRYICMSPSRGICRQG